MRHSGLIFIQIVFYLEFKFLKTNFLKRNPWYDLFFYCICNGNKTERGKALLSLHALLRNEITNKYTLQDKYKS